MRERKDKAGDPTQEFSGHGARRDTAGKRDGKPDLPVPVATPAMAVAAAPPAALGLPSAGIEPGSNAEASPIQSPTAAAASLNDLAGDAAAVSEIPIRSAPAGPAVPPADLQTELAFALKLAPVAPDQEAAARQAQGQMKVVAAPPAEASQNAIPAPLAAAFSAAAAPADTAAEGKPVRVAAGEPASTAHAVSPPPLPGASIAPASGARQQQSGGSPDKQASHTAQKSEPAPVAAESRSQRQPGPAQADAGPVAKQSGPDLSSALAPAPAAPAAGSSAPERTVDAPAPHASSAGIEAPAAQVPLTPSASVTEISVNVPMPRAEGSSDERVAIRMVQKGGEIHVSVRAPDTQLAQSLRQDLGKLSDGLDQAGFRTEAWRPATAAAASSQSNPNPQHESPHGNPGQEWNGRDGRSGGQGGNGAQEQRKRQQDQRPRWVAELEQQQNR